MNIKVEGGWVTRNGEGRRVSMRIEERSRRDAVDVLELS
jgi:hypothetical protein